MDRIIERSLMIPTPHMTGHQFILVDDPDLTHRCHDRHLAVGIRRRHRVGIGIEVHQGERIDTGVSPHPTGLERSLREFQHRRAIVAEQRGNHTPAPHRPLLIPLTG